jgi:hypothetical protein
MVGLAVAMMLARDGHEVTVLEGDPEEAPAPLAAAWGGAPGRGGPVPPAAQRLSAVPAGRRRGAAGADGPRGGGASLSPPGADVVVGGWAGLRCGEGVTDLDEVAVGVADVDRQQR